jgi:hypothetical protein
MTVIAGVRVPDGGLTNDATELIRDSTSPFIFHHWRWASHPDVSGDTCRSLQHHRRGEGYDQYSG